MVLRNILGKRFMVDYHVDAELAPRDIVARSIYLETQKPLIRRDDFSFLQKIKE